MRIRDLWTKRLVVAACGLLLAARAAMAGTPLDSAFVYQGRLRDAGVPVTGTPSLEFSLWDAAANGSQIGPTQPSLSHPVAKGLFTAKLDFGSGAFDGDARWLQIVVDGTTLAPRQKLTAAPYALCALTALEARAVQWPAVLGAPPIVSSINGVTHNGDNIDLVAGPGIAIAPDDTANTITIEATGAIGPFWSLNGNAGTDPTTQFIGTTDQQSLWIRVNGIHAMRFQPGLPPSVIGGYFGNAVAEPVRGGTISGGGAAGAAHSVTADFGTIGGGEGNQATAQHATIGGGNGNLASGGNAIVGGGLSNEAGNHDTTVAGGLYNTASGLNATIGGGSNNVASWDRATIAGGESNTASAWATAVGGGYQNVAGGSGAAIAGGRDNEITGNNGTIAGGQANQVTAQHGTVGGGHWNIAAAAYATIAGGGPYDAGDPAGTSNRALDQFGAVGGGGGNLAGSDDGDTTTAWFTTVGGGYGNTAGGPYATVAGGTVNEASGVASAVGGGTSNTATGPSATVGGGSGNLAEYDDATVAGGHVNTASGYMTAVGGGTGNHATGYAATVPGGYDNSAGGICSFAAGRRAKAGHSGAFVWADAIDADFASTADNQFVARATGGVKLWVDTAASGLRLLPVEHATLGVSTNVLAGFGGNHATADVIGATVSGGGRLNEANRVAASFGAVGGGLDNAAEGYCATVGGGEGNGATGGHSAVGGGEDNLAGRYHATVAGGVGNRAVNASTTVGGGQDNVAGDVAAVMAGPYATVAGGAQNTASVYAAAVSGGYNNTANGNSAVVGGGNGNEASAHCATVPGGRFCAARADFSFAAGLKAKANHTGSFVWADSTDADFASVRNDHFHVKATGGVGLNINGGWMEIYIDTPSNRFLHTSTGAWLTTGGIWTNNSDAASKESFTPVDGRDVLRRVAALPITAWSYRAEDPAVRHVGPMAQDFHAAFGLGADDTSIGTLDADGVALAAIQGLHDIVREREAQLADMATRLDQKDGQIAELTQRLARLEALITKLASTRTREK